MRVVKGWQGLDYGAIVIGAGHNGLICAAYLARAGIRTLVVEARSNVGGQAATEHVLGGAAVNICNCDHGMVRTTSILAELELERHGLRYLEVDPASLAVHWSGGPGWFSFHDVDRTLESLQISYPDEVDAYRRYVKNAVPVARMVSEIGQATPTPGSVLGNLSRNLGRSSRAIPTMLQWLRRSAADVLRSYFTADQVLTPALTLGPTVWGVAPEAPGSGLGALTYATKHVVPTGRPVGGSGALPLAVQAAFEEAGGTVRLGAKVRHILCDGPAVRGVELDSGEVIEAPIVVSAGDTHNALVRWLKDPPVAVQPLVDRYRSMPVAEGYEAKVDAVLDARYEWPGVDDTMLARLGITRDQSLFPSAVVSKSIAEITADHAAAARGRIAERPQFLVQAPSVLDPSVAAALPAGSEVFSLEVLWAPHNLEGGWAGSAEPERWLRKVSELVTMPDGRPFHEHIVSWRLMGPVEYDRELSMPRGHAQSFAGTPFTALWGRNREQTRYETPVRGLFLTGAGTFPGAGVWGASGRNAASAVLASDGRSARARRAVVDAVG